MTLIDNNVVEVHVLDMQLIWTIHIIQTVLFCWEELIINDGIHLIQIVFIPSCRTHAHYERTLSSNRGAIGSKAGKEPSPLQQQAQTTECVLGTYWMHRIYMLVQYNYLSIGLYLYIKLPINILDKQHFSAVFAPIISQAPNIDSIISLICLGFAVQRQNSKNSILIESVSNILVKYACISIELTLQFYIHFWCINDATMHIMRIRPPL